MAAPEGRWVKTAAEERWEIVAAEAWKKAGPEERRAIAAAVERRAIAAAEERRVIAAAEAEAVRRSELMKQRTLLSTLGSSALWNASSAAASSPFYHRSLSNYASSSSTYRTFPNSEVVIKDLSCAMHESFVTFEGRMYLFPSYIFFHGKDVCGSETQRIIHIEEISAVGKIPGVICRYPAAIKITTAGQEYIFSSFASREEAFTLINDVYPKLRNPRPLALPLQLEEKPKIYSLWDPYAVEEEEYLKSSVTTNTNSVNFADQFEQKPN